MHTALWALSIIIQLICLCIFLIHVYLASFDQKGDAPGLLLRPQRSKTQTTHFNSDSKQSQHKNSNSSTSRFMWNCSLPPKSKILAHYDQTWANHSRLQNVSWPHLQWFINHINLALCSDAPSQTKMYWIDKKKLRHFQRMWSLSCMPQWWSMLWLLYISASAVFVVEHAILEIQYEGFYRVSQKRPKWGAIYLSIVY